ncbi:gem-associated protein 2-like isoform X2 [Ornithodoros turicata]|uniref:gem-associated protein 2-like isoform X2 n=1 Tax=Ornithodoros turicata TaxID=34597 RepID=UPI003139CCF3
MMRKTLSTDKNILVLARVLRRLCLATFLCSPILFEMSDDDRDDIPMVRAFSVEETGEEFDLDIPPTTGNEYLRRVQREAKTCPDVVVANLDVSKFSSKQTVTVNDNNECTPPPKGFAPPLKWQQEQVANFSAVRQKLARYKAVMKKNKVKPPIRLPKIDDKTKWRSLCCGQETNNEPLLSIIGNLPQHNIERLISYHTEWIRDSGFVSHMGKWLYALLACLEKPLHPEACFHIRALARACSSSRSTLVSAEDECLVPLNLLICLIAYYFSQQDLADEPS